jgi:hypothetical protein
MKMSCPKCDSPLLDGEDEDSPVYRCGTIYSGGQCESQSPLCYERSHPNRCELCGFPIHKSERICGECACEDDGL